MTNIIAVFVIISALYFIMRGIVEGIIMVMPNDVMYETSQHPGPRSHIWFGAYHLFTLTRDVALIAAIWVAVRYATVAAIPGMLLLGWELSEITYSTSRYALLWPTQENLLGSGIRIRGRNLAVLHLLRLAAGTILLSHLT